MLEKWKIMPVYRILKNGMVLIFGGQHEMKHATAREF